MGRVVSAFGSVVLAENMADTYRALDAVGRLVGAVVDVLLKPGNGLDIVDRLQIEHPGVSTLVVTGDLAPERINDACLRGAEFLAKPFKPDVLRAWAARVAEPPMCSMATWELPGHLPEDLRTLAAKVIDASNCLSHAKGVPSLRERGELSVGVPV